MSAIQRVAIVLYDGVELLDFAGPAEVFAVTNRQAQPLYQVYTVAANMHPLRSQGFLEINPQYEVADAPDPDILVIPGGNREVFKPGTSLMTWIKRIATTQATILTVCTGAFALARLGLLDGCSATTWHGHIEDLRREAPRTRIHAGQRYVDNGQIITTAGVSAGIDGALHLISKTFGADIAQQTATYIEYDRWIPGEGLVCSVEP